jgi:hypothetical protein
MRRVVRALLAIAMPVLAFAVNLPKPLMSNVTTGRRDVLGIRITDAGLEYASGTGATTSPVVNGSVCVPKTINPVSLSFDNATLKTWRVRLVPPPPKPDAPPASCNTFPCARSKDDLEAMGLCDGDEGADKDVCLTTAKALASCFGPECTAIRDKCKLEGEPRNRTCKVQIVDVIDSCEEKRCSGGRRLDPDDPKRSGFTSIPFSAETVGAPPFKFEIYDEADKIRTLEVTTGTQNDACATLLPERTEIDNVAVVPLDNVGVASWVYLNPRAPACLTCDGRAMPSLAFVNRTSDRSFTVSIEFPAEVSPKVKGCEVGKPCKFSNTVTPNNSIVIDADLLSLIPPISSRLL